MKNKLIRLIQNNLTDDLLKPKYRKRKGKYAGHCYVATECFYYMYGRWYGWKPYCYRYKNGETHWWLQKDSEIIDITAEQLKPGFDYSKGHKQFFVNYPSKRCETLAKRVDAEIRKDTFVGAAEVVHKELNTLRKVIFEQAQEDYNRIKKILRRKK